MNEVRCLFVAVETGAAAYLEPLWRRWLNRKVAGWNIVGAAAARRFIAQNGLDALPLLPHEPESVSEIAAMLPEPRPEIILLSASSSALERLFIAYARQSQTPILQFIDTWYNYRERFEHADGVHWPDRVLVVNKNAAREAIAAGVPRDLVFVAGQPAWELTERLPPANPSHVLFVDQPVAALYGTRLGYSENEAWSLVQHAANLRPDLIEHLVYCPHPGHAPGATLPLEGINVVTNGSAALEEFGTVTGMFASLLTNALLAGRHVISVQPDAKATDMCGLSRFGHLRRVTSIDELIQELEQPSFNDRIDQLSKEFEGSCDQLERAVTEAIA